MIYKRSFFLIVLLALLWLWLTVAIDAQEPIDTTFTFQGRLIQNDVFVTDTCDFQFSLFDDPSAGSQQGPTINKTAVSVLEGYFTADLDFGSVFTGNKRYLQVSVQCSADGGLLALTGRMELTGTPYALYSLNAANTGNTNWANITSIPAPDFADNIDNTGELNNYNCNQPSLNILITDTVTAGGWGCGSDAGSVPFTLDHGINLITTSLADDDHPQYLLVNGSRAMAGILSMATRRITNLANGTNPTDAANRAQTVEQPETGGDLAGTNPYNNALVAGIRGRPITITALVNLDGLRWNGTQWQNGLVQPSGPAGGDFTGTFPDPQIAANAVNAAKIITDAVGASEIAANAVDSAEIADNAVGASEIVADGVNTSEIAANAVGMSELNIPMGFWATANRTFTPNAGTYIYGTGTFTPEATGQCVVVASASVASSGSSSQDGGYLRTAREANGVNSQDSQDGQFGFYFDDAANQPSVTVNHVWDVTGGQAIRFGCYIVSVEDIFGNNETVDCRVSYVCE